MQAANLTFKTNYAEFYGNECPEDECQLQKTEKQKQIAQQKAEEEKEAQRCKLKEYTASNIMVWKIYYDLWNSIKKVLDWIWFLKPIFWWNFWNMRNLTI